MVACKFGGPNFICKMIPVKELDSEFLYEQTTALLEDMKQSGAEVAAIIWYCNKVNLFFFFFKKFETISPWQTTDNIFTLYDFVHIFKNLRNNWITEKSKELNFMNVGVLNTAQWSDLERLYKQEQEKLVKLTNITEVAIHPKPIENKKWHQCFKYSMRK